MLIDIQNISLMKNRLTDIAIVFLFEGCKVLTLSCAPAKDDNN